MSTLTSIGCMECGRPWGVYGGTQGERELRLASDHADWWEDYVEQWLPEEEPEMPPVSPTKEVQIVRLTERGVEFAYEQLGAEPPEPGWYELDEMSCWGVPMWWARSRTVKEATRTTECGCT